MTHVIETIVLPKIQGWRLELQRSKCNFRILGFYFYRPLSNSFSFLFNDKNKSCLIESSFEYPMPMASRIPAWATGWSCALPVRGVLISRLWTTNMVHHYKQQLTLENLELLNSLFKLLQCRWQRPRWSIWWATGSCGFLGARGHGPFVACRGC